ncbi:diaminopimelate epimerase [uncultured Muribaculum sp.]|uniref:diaminopimelate epimerase n=1 Tax=uncultured Muribaculum sp. TaxID=1918613 RepID=UPI0025EF8A74|nr:diaminopimelate epimerase [uncultured Muribaculum sp.]
MIKEIPFTKMHGIGNDYIYINCMDRVPDKLPRLAIEMSDRHTGVGGDGIILICPSECADFKMRIFNADGSEARMCGNGSRCVGRYVYESHLTDKTTVTLETLSGVKTLRLHPDADDRITSVTVDMGIPEIDTAEVPVTFDSPQMVNENVATTLGPVKITAVSMGNPHGVTIVDDVDTAPVDTLGPELERHPMWPDRANIEFAEVVSPVELRMRVWERGSGETMACGTGACATLVACVLNGLSKRHAVVHLLGGDLEIEWDPADSHVYMTGPAETVFHGTYRRR